jgi:hypothetical protein
MDALLSVIPNDHWRVGFDEGDLSEKMKQALGQLYLGGFMSRILKDKPERLRSGRHSLRKLIQRQVMSV